MIHYYIYQSRISKNQHRHHSDTCILLATYIPSRTESEIISLQSQTSYNQPLAISKLQALRVKRHQKVILTASAGQQPFRICPALRLPPIHEHEAGDALLLGWWVRASTPGDSWGIPLTCRTHNRITCFSGGLVLTRLSWFSFPRRSGWYLLFTRTTFLELSLVFRIPNLGCRGQYFIFRIPGLAVHVIQQSDMV